ncbi:MAG TPA: hypothetical protein DD613_02060 [Firmicutes bacterium]|nr:hypothetical protein [Bacillota bacterium]
MNKKFLLILIIITCLFSCSIFGLYKRKSVVKNKYYLLQVGAYKNYDSISKKTKEYENYLVLKEEDLYKLYIGVTKDKEVYKKLVNLYASTSSIYKKEITLSNQKFDDTLTKYDSLIKNSEDIKEINLVIKSELKFLEEMLAKKSN